MCKYIPYSIDRQGTQTHNHQWRQTMTQTTETTGSELVEFASLLTEALETKCIAVQVSVEQELWERWGFDFQEFLLMIPAKIK